MKDLLIKLYPEATFQYIDNPRAEKASNGLIVKNDKFTNMGHKGI